MLGLPKLSVEPVLFLAPFLGGFRDYSGNGIHGTPGASIWWQSTGGCDGIFCPANGAGISVGANAKIAALSGATFFMAGDFVSQKQFAGLFIFSSSVPRWYMSTTALFLYDGTDFSSLNANVIGSKSLAVTVPASPGKPEFFADAGSLGLGSLNVDVSWPLETMQWLSLSGANGIRSPVNTIIGYPGVLSQPELAELHAYSQSLITPRRQWPGSGLRYPGRETNLLVDPANPASWIPANSGVITGIENGIRISYGGAVNPACYQTVLAAGTQYRITAEGRGDGVAFPRVYGDVPTIVWSGTTSDAWQPIDIKWIQATTGKLFLFGITTAASSVEFRNLKVWTNPPGYTHATGDPTYLDNLQTARVSVGDETSGKLSNTGMDIVTGTWRVSEDATGRYYNCVGNGQIKRRLIGADAMATRLFTEEGSATLTKTTTAIEIDALATDKIRAVQLEAA